MLLNPGSATSEGIIIPATRPINSGGKREGQVSKRQNKPPSEILFISGPEGAAHNWVGLPTSIKAKRTVLSGEAPHSGDFYLVAS